MTRALLRVLFRVRVIGDTEAVHSQRLIIVANHDFLLDSAWRAAFPRS